MTVWVKRNDALMVLDPGRPHTSPLFRACVVAEADGYWWSCGVTTRYLGQVDRYCDSPAETLEQAQAEAEAYLDDMLGDLHPRLLEDPRGAVSGAEAEGENPGIAELQEVQGTPCAAPVWVSDNSDPAWAEGWAVESAQQMALTLERVRAEQAETLAQVLLKLEAAQQPKTVRVGIRDWILDALAGDDTAQGQDVRQWLDSLVVVDPDAGEAGE